MGVSYKDFHDAENDFKASRKNSKVTLVSEKSFDHAIPESSMGFNLSDEKLKNADVGNDLHKFF